MTSLNIETPVTEVQTAADLVVGAAGDEDQGPSALELLAGTIMERFDVEVPSTATHRMFSPELPLELQRFSAAWLMWILSQNAMALNFGDTERLMVSLCDRAVPEIYLPESPKDTRRLKNCRRWSISSGR